MVVVANETMSPSIGVAEPVKGDLHVATVNSCPFERGGSLVVTVGERVTVGTDASGSATALTLLLPALAIATICVP